MGQLFSSCMVHACLKAWGTCALMLTARNLHEHVADSLEGGFDSFVEVLIIVSRNALKQYRRES
jgi:hypothetical protein